MKQWQNGEGLVSFITQVDTGRGGEGGLANAPAGSKLLTSQHNHLCFLPLFCFISTMDANRRVKNGEGLGMRLPLTVNEENSDKLSVKRLLLT